MFYSTLDEREGRIEAVRELRNAALGNPAISMEMASNIYLSLLPELMLYVDMGIQKINDRSEEMILSSHPLAPLFSFIVEAETGKRVIDSLLEGLV